MAKSQCRAHARRRSCAARGRVAGARGRALAGPDAGGADRRVHAADAPRARSPRVRARVRARAYEAAEHARADAEQVRAHADRELGDLQRAEEALRESETKYRALAARTNRLYGLSAALSQAVTLDAVAKAIVRKGRNV